MHDNGRTENGGPDMATVTKGRVKKGFVVLHLRFWKQDDRWYGECLELGTSTFADELETVQTELVELIELHLNSLETVRERERFFADNGIKLYTDEPAPNEVTGKIAVSGDPSHPLFRLDTALKLPVPA